MSSGQDLRLPSSLCPAFPSEHHFVWPLIIYAQKRTRLLLIASVLQIGKVKLTALMCSVFVSLACFSKTHQTAGLSNWDLFLLCVWDGWSRFYTDRSGVGRCTSWHGDLSSVHVLVRDKGDRALFDGCKDGVWWGLYLSVMELNGRPRLGQEDGIHAPPFLKEERNSQLHTSGSVAAGLGSCCLLCFIFLLWVPFQKLSIVDPSPCLLIILLSL